MMARLVAAVMAIAMCGLANAATINVPGDYPTIQDAIDASVGGDEILVAPGTYTGSGNSEVINPSGKAIIIKATGAVEETTLDGEGARQVVRCDSGEGSDTVIEGFTITGGHGFVGGLLIESSMPTIRGCMITDNTGYMGGGIRLHGSNCTITDCVISGNNSLGSSGENTWAGGGIFIHFSSPTISGCKINDNYAEGGKGQGGGIYCSAGNPMIETCEIKNNIAAYGGGISCAPLGGGPSNPTIIDCTIAENISSLGGGVYGGSGTSIPVLQGTSVCSNIPSEVQILGDWTDNGSNTIAEVCPWYQGACCTGNDLACVVATEQDCERFGHTWLGEGTTCDDSPCPIACLGDVTGDGQVSVNDVLTVIGNWGPCP